MEIKNVNFREHIFLFILIPLIIIVGVISYYRFMVKQDYIVSYEGVCDPIIKECFVGYDGNDQYFYSIVQKYAPDLYGECGEDITDCEAANICLPNDRECSVTYCEAEIDGEVCETLTEELNVQNSDQIDFTEEEYLQSYNIDNTNI